jgi:hypothetical protein
MARPLKVFNNPSFVGLRELSNTEIEGHISKIILEDFAANTGAGHININGSGTAIGTFIDTYRPYSVGQHPVGTDITSTTYNFYQNLTAVSTSPTRPLKQTLNGAEVRLGEFTDTEITDDLISLVASTMVSGGPGIFVLQPSAPTGGTWINVGTINNTVTPGTTVSTNLWMKTSTGVSATDIRPVKSSGSGNSQEMTDAEIKTLTAFLRNYIISSGVGQYKLQTSTPTGGTWITSGAAFEDTRQQAGNVSYSGTYAGTYAGAYAGTYVLYYGGRNYGSYTGYYTGYYTGNYTGNYTGLTISGSTETINTLSLWLRTV